MKKYLQIGIILILVSVAVWFFASGTTAKLEFTQVQQRSQEFADFVAQNYLLAVLLFMIIYIAVIAVSLPGAAVMTLLGGFLFQFWGIIFVNLSATIGAIINFFVARYVAGDALQKRYTKQLDTFNTEFASYEFGYAMFVRLVPVFPFFLVNILAGLTQMKPRTFIVTTALGTLPGTAVYVYAGQQLQSLQSPADVVSPSFLGVFAAFGILALVPLVIKKIQQSRA